MRVLPSGTTAVLVEVDHLDQVLELYAALADAPPVGVVDVVPAARTVLVVIDPAVTTLSAVSRAVLTRRRSNRVLSPAGWCRYRSAMTVRTWRRPPACWAVTSPG
jgi:allophanate hydrolase subunit 1